MRTAVVVSLSWHVAAGSYHTVGAQYLIIIGIAEVGRKAFAGTMSKVILRVSQTYRLRDSFQIRPGIWT